MIPAVATVLDYSKGLRTCLIIEHKLQCDGINSTVLHGLMTSLQTGSNHHKYPRQNQVYHKTVLGPIF